MWQALAANLSTSKYVQHLADCSAAGSVPTCCLSLLDSGLLCAVAMHQLPEQLLCLRHFPCAALATELLVRNHVCICRNILQCVVSAASTQAVAALQVCTDRLC